MNWRPVLWNLSDARRELTLLVARVQCAAFRKVVHQELKDCEVLALTENRERPLSEGQLLLSMNYVYKHLNRAWNGRNASMETVARCERTDVSRWERFPTHSIFSDLRQPLRLRWSKPPRIAWKGRIDPKAIHPYLQYALRKLDILCFLVEYHHGAKDAPKPKRPAGIFDHVAKIPLSEAGLGRRLHRIYGEMNYAWAIRKPNCTHASGISRQALARRGWFPRVFPQ